jgi:hypothetical protein
VNKVIACLLLAVALLGMALVMLNQQLTPPAPTLQGPQSATSKLPDLPSIEGGRQSAPPVQDGQTARQELPPLPDSLEAPGAEHRAPVASTTLAEARSQETASAVQPPEPSAAVQPGTQAGAEKPAQEALDEARRQEQARAEAEAKRQEARRQEQAKAEAEAKRQEARRQEQAKAEAEAKRQEARKQEQAQQPRIKTGKVVVFARDKGATVRLSSAESIDYRHMVLKEPDRVVLDLQGSWNVSAAGVPRNVLVTNIRFGSFPGRTRVVIDMKGTPRQTRLSQTKDRRQLDVRVDQ